MQVSILKTELCQETYWKPNYNKDLKEFQINLPGS